MSLSIIVDIKDGEHFIATFSQFDNKLVDVLKTLPNRTFDKKIGAWVFPIIDLFILKKIAEVAEIPVLVTKKANEQYLALASEMKRIKDIAEQKQTEYDIAGLKKEVVLRNFQKVGIEYLDVIQNGLMGYDMGLGKFSCLDAKLLTPNGFIRMGDVKIGDEIFGSDGKPYVVSGVFPQGKKRIYEIEFTDGSKTTSGEEHLWAVQSAVQKYRKQGFKPIILKDFMNDLYDKNGNTKWFIPMVKSIKFDKKLLTIDPYILGALIGDGSLHGGSIQFTSADSFIINQFKEILNSKCNIKKGNRYNHNISNIDINKFSLKKEIEKLNLNVLSYNKFIPDIYKFGSILQRIAILQGLMDTDGGVDTKKDGIVISYSSTSEKLIDDIRFIVESLGGTGRKTTRITQYTYKGIKKQGRRSWRLNISLPSNIIPFRLPRKLNAYTPRTKYQPYRGIKSVTHIGKKDAQCISVSSPDHLYVTDHCILTHNTPIGIAVASNAINKYGAKKILTIVPASMKDQWGYQIAKFSNYTYTIINGKDREKQYRKHTDFIIVNYDLIYRDIDFIKDIEWDLVICDEIQRARNYKTDTFKALNQLQAKRKIGLTGTPIENDLMDLFTIMKFLNPKLFGTNAHSFIQRYCTLNFFGQIDHSKYKNLTEINKKLGFGMIRRRKRDVLDELPEKTINHFYIQLNDVEKKHYKEIKNGILEDINSGKIKNVSALSQVIFLRELCDCLNLVISKDKIVSSKLDELKKILKELPEDSKIIIFTQFERMAKILEANIGMKSTHLHGGVKQGCRWGDETERDITKKNKKALQKELDIMVHEGRSALKCIDCPYFNDDSKCNTRKKVIARFEHDKETRVFISTNAGASGLDLQFANVIINYDLSFNPAVNEQRIARIDRMGQESEKILVINLICSDTIEEKVLKILEKKQKLFDKVIDDMDEAESEKIIFNTTNIKDLL